MRSQPQVSTFIRQASFQQAKTRRCRKINQNRELDDRAWALTTRENLTHL